MSLLSAVESAIESAITTVVDEVKILEKELVSELYEIGEELGLVGAEVSSGGDVGTPSAGQGWPVSVVLSFSIVDIPAILPKVIPMKTTPLRLDQTATVTAALTDFKGNEIAAPGTTPAWSVDNTAVATVVPAADGLTAQIVPVGVGTAVVTYSLNSNPNPNEAPVPVTSSVTVIVSAGLATAAVLTATVTDNLAVDGVAPAPAAAAPAGAPAEAPAEAPAAPAAAETTTAPAADSAAPAAAA